MKKLLVYVHGKGGNIDEANHYKKMLKNIDIVGFDYVSNTPWEAKKEFKKYFEEHSKQYDSIVLVANSIGAFFSLISLNNIDKIEKALFISPIVDMENLILNMMKWANVNEDELSKKKEIKTSFGETLSWEYLNYVRENPVIWNIKTYILYGDKDNLTSLDVINNFAAKTNSKLTIMKNGEHYFHDDAQMKFLDKWFLESIN